VVGGEKVFVLMAQGLMGGDGLSGMRATGKCEGHVWLHLVRE